MMMMMTMTTTTMMMMKQLMRMKLGISARLNLLQTIMHLMVIHLLWHSGPLYCWPPLMRWILHWLPTSLCRWSSYQTLSKIDPYYGGRWHQRFFCCIQFPPASLWGGATSCSWESTIDSSSRRSSLPQHSHRKWLVWVGVAEEPAIYCCYGDIVVQVILAVTNFLDYQKFL